MRVWLALAAIALAGFLIPVFTDPATVRTDNVYRLAFENMSLSEMDLTFGSFALFMVAFLRAMFLMQRYLRCPNCETPVTDADGEPTMKASSCSKCGAQLS